ncbi:hypothetical protein CPB84DRAFT_1830632 [Gymnopilus junonius]|uniref:Uncharacterized protein n=1 Tax=Gymnopilus junonius TaxID=109634 RepID=A0A9P5N917_GYMJU|nr:hypothetical protein CPB84DRAFT_1830632 [Gymnopilus junonius]
MALLSSGPLTMPTILAFSRFDLTYFRHHFRKPSLYCPTGRRLEEGTKESTLFL